MGKLEMVRQFDPVAPSDAPGCRRPFADAVERQDGGFFEWTREERAGSMAFVMVHEQSGACLSGQAPRIMRRIMSFSRSHTGIAIRSCGIPLGANAS